MKKRIVAMVLLAAFMLTACSTGGESQTSATEGTATETTESTEATSETSEDTEESETGESTTATTTEMPTVPFEPVEQPEDAVAKEGYHFVWGDEFNGDSLNEKTWTRETHEKGWVNHELQEYKADEKYAYVKNGMLIIQPVKEEKDGQVKYYSGRVNTCDKFTCRYGRIEARIKTPEGKGFLPAFWMLPNRGRWPIGGEIDIMEIVGGQENSVHGTLHFGNPHDMRQGSYTFDDIELSDDFHVYACEWEPGKISFYIDDILFFTESDWFSAPAATLVYDYPAPFNKPFYIIFNVAVGGDWPGDPDEKTKFDKHAQMRVDWVRVYQKDAYDENVTKPNT